MGLCWGTATQGRARHPCPRGPFHLVQRGHQVTRNTDPVPCAPWAGRQWTASALGAQRAGARQGHTVQTGPAPAPCLGQSPGALPWPPGVQAATGFKGKCTLHRWVWGGAGWGWGRRPRRAAHPGDREPLTSVLGLPSLPGEEGQGEPGALGGVGGIRFIRPASTHETSLPAPGPGLRTMCRSPRRL